MMNKIADILKEKTGSGTESGERGSVILMAVFIVFFAGALMITLEMMRLSDLEIISNQIEDMEAHYCAESGLEFNIWRIRAFPLFFPPRANAPYSNTFPSAACTSGAPVNTGWTYQVQMSTYKADTDANVRFYHYIDIISTGSTDAYTRRVRVQARRIWFGFALSDYRFLQLRRWREL